jgi:hypothetical protein
MALKMGRSGAIAPFTVATACLSARGSVVSGL